MSFYANLRANFLFVVVLEVCVDAVVRCVV